jgi:hypothetical protein
MDWKSGGLAWKRMERMELMGRSLIPSFPPVGKVGEMEKGEDK